MSDENPLEKDENLTFTFAGISLWCAFIALWALLGFGWAMAFAAVICGTIAVLGYWYVRLRRRELKEKDTMKATLLSIAAAFLVLAACTDDASAWGRYRSPYRYYGYGPNNTQVWGIPRYGYWGPRWRHDPWWVYSRPCCW